MDTKKIAHAISYFSEPTALLALLATLAGFQANMKPLPMGIYFFILYGFMIIPAIMLRIYMLRKKMVSDWDISDRSQRIRPLAFLLVLLSINYALITLLGNPFLLNLYVRFLIYLVGFFIMTFKFKISGHTSVATMTLFLVSDWLGINFWFMVPVIILISWSRYYLRAHTLFQIIAGILYAFLILFI